MSAEDGCRLHKRRARALVAAGIAGFAALMISACAGSGGSGSRPGIQGRVVGPDGPVPEVRISTEPPTDVRLTDVSGNFRIAEVVANNGAEIPSGKYKLIAFKAGWKPIETQIEYDGGDLIIPDMQMAPINPNEPILEAGDVPSQDPNKTPTTGGRTVGGE